MRHYARIAQEAFPEWNVFAHSIGEMEEFCEVNKIAVLKHQTPFLGEYLIYKQQPCIILDPNLKAGKLLWVFAHECGHYLFHHPYSQRFNGSQYQQNIFYSKLDFQANFFASILLIPVADVKSKPLYELAEENGYCKELLLIRKDIFERYKI